MPQTTHLGMVTIPQPFMVIWEVVYGIVLPKHFLPTWGFPEIGIKPQIIIHFWLGFSQTKAIQRFWGTCMAMETPTSGWPGRQWSSQKADGHRGPANLGAGDPPIGHLRPFPKRGLSQNGCFKRENPILHDFVNCYLLHYLWQTNIPVENGPFLADLPTVRALSRKMFLVS